MDIINTYNRINWSCGLKLFTASILSFIIIASQSQADPVNSDLVKRTAITFLNNQLSSGAQKPALTTTISEVKEISEENGKTLAYIAELEPEGFIIISADTDLKPIIGYSIKGNFPFQEAHDNVLLHLVKWDMKARLENLDYINADLQNLVQSNNESWNNYISNNQNSFFLNKVSSYDYYLIETEWDQIPAFNKCPEIYDTNTNYKRRCSVGCVAVAAAQILNYHKYPKSMYFSNNNDSYTSEIEFNNEILTINIPEHSLPYDFPPFDELNDRLSNIQYNGDDEEKAYLCFATGIKLKMNYSPDRSAVPTTFISENIRDIFRNEFGYLSALSKDWPWPECKNDVIDNIKVKWPVMMGILENIDSTEGHEVIVDGYDEESDMFHVNMGKWDGYGTTWYSLPIIDNYSVINHVVYNIVPPIPIVDAGGHYSCYDNEVLNLTGTVHGSEEQIVFYNWDFGDGSNPWRSTSNATITHQYAEGTYTATFSVELATGGVVSNNAQITVLSPGLFPFNMILIPGGTFQMGDIENASNPEYSHEKPVHTVTLDGFEMSTTEITNTQYTVYLNEALASGDITATNSSVAGNTGDYINMQYIFLSGIDDWESGAPGYSACEISYSNGTFSVSSGKENWPVVYVSWYGAKSFSLHYGLDLPTEAEWEYAARGGKQYMYGTDDGTLNSTRAHIYRSTPTDVGSYPANPFGLYDMCGNVLDWVNDWWGPYNIDSVINPTGPSYGNYRVYRSSDFSHFAYAHRTARRGYVRPYQTSSGLGFRVVFRSSHTVYGTLEITSPNGGESWEASTPQNITWTSSGVTNVMLEYSTNNGTDWTEIVASTDASVGTFPWTVPIRPSVNCKVRITDASNASVTDTRDATFTITESMGETILFQSEKDYNTGCPAIWVMNPDGSNQNRLTNSLAYDILPSWSPDGTKIVFTSDRDGGTADSREIYVMDADGSNPIRLTNNSAYDDYSSWSPDGSKIAFLSTRDSGWEIYVMDADGSNPIRLTNNPNNDFNPTWSPDGSKIAFSTNRDGNMSIYVMNADGSNQTGLTNNSAKDYYPTWSPDGSKIAFSSNRDVNNQIFVMDADGSNQTRLTNNSEIGSHSWSSWSPDGSKIAYQATYDGGNQAIYVMDSDGSNPIRITNNLANDDFPSWARPVYAEMTEVLSIADAAAQGWMNGYCYTFDGYEYVLISPYESTDILPCSGFWVVVRQDMDLLIPKLEDPPSPSGTLSFNVYPNDYFLISAPLDPVSNRDINVNIGDDLGDGLYEKKWRVAKWNYNTEIYEYYNGPGTLPGTLADIIPGRGFFLQHIHPEPKVIDITGNYIDPVDYYEMNLPSNGDPYTYHMAGNPYWYSIQWKDCKVRVPMTDGLPLAKPAVVAANEIETWHVSLKLESLSGEACDTYNRAGVAINYEGSTEFLCAFDMTPPGNYVRLALKDPFNEVRESLAYDYRPSGLYEYSWEVELTTTYDKIDVKFTLDNFDFVPDDFFIILKDTETGDVLTISDDISFDLELTSGSTKTYVLTATSMQNIETIVEEEEDRKPLSFGIAGINPNPFNPATTVSYTLDMPGNVTLKIYNLNGQLVDTIVDGYIDAGYHSVVWNAKGHASGIYVVSLVSQGKRGFSKITLVK